MVRESQGRRPRAIRYWLDRLLVRGVLEIQETDADLRSSRSGKGNDRLAAPWVIHSPQIEEKEIGPGISSRCCLSSVECPELVH